MQVNEIAAQLTTKKKDLDEILEAYLGVHPRCTARKAMGMLEGSERRSGTRNGCCASRLGEVGACQRNTNLFQRL